MTTKWTQADVDRLSKQLNPQNIPERVTWKEPAKKTKYNNRKTMVDGEVLDSAKEAKRYQELMIQQQAGQIAGLRRQVTYALTCNGELICKYVADFVYQIGTKKVVEDVKSEATRKLPVYSIKKKMMLACHGIAVQEV